MAELTQLCCLKNLNKVYLFFVSFATIVFFYFYYLFFVKDINSEKLLIEISKGDSVKTISNIVLKNHNYIDNKLYVLFLFFWDEYINNVNFGEFELSRELNLFEITKIITHPSNFYRKLTIVDGWQYFQVNNYVQSVFSHDFQFQYNEILADTYKYQKHNELKDIYDYMKIFKMNFFEKYKDNSLFKKYTVDQIMIIASLVEREGIDEYDKKLISSVIFNRLDKNMKLQIDASTIYAITKGNYKFDRKLLLTDLKIKDKFNTYFIKGLPPNPICFVGRKTIEIILENYNSKYLFYFYNNKLNKHIYSETFDDHKRKLILYKNNNEK